MNRRYPGFSQLIACRHSQTTCSAFSIGGPIIAYFSSLRTGSMPTCSESCSMTDPTVAASRYWDVIIIGTGIGGATVGRSLALAGLSVLFLEKGGRVSPNAE